MEDITRLKSDILTVASISNVNVDDTKFNLLLEDVLSNYNIERLTKLNAENDFTEKFKLYLNGKRIEGLSEITLKNYGYELVRFANYTNKPISTITTQDIREYLSSYDNIKNSTLGSKVTVLKSFFMWLQKEEYILKNPTLKIPTPKKDINLPKSLNTDEVELIRDSCETLQEQVIIELLISTGCRLSEISHLNKNDIDMASRSIRVFGKGSRERTVFLSSKAFFVLNKYLNSRKDNCEALIVTVRHPIRQLSNRGIQYIVKRIAKRSGIKKDIHCHSFRHTFSQNMVDSGVDIVDLQYILGHSSCDTTTKIYGRISEERKRNAFKKYHTI